MSIFTGLLSCQFAEKKAADIASVHYVQTDSAEKSLFMRFVVTLKDILPQ